MNRATSPRGFTLIELMVVLAVIAILALMAMPNMQDKLVREQIVEAMKLADIAKAPVAAGWRATKSLPADNDAAGLPAADRIVSNLVSSVAVTAGAIHVTFGNQANGVIRGKTLSLRPAVIEDAQIVPVAWVCGNAPAPQNMVVQGGNNTNVAANYLPRNCR